MKHEGPAQAPGLRGLDELRHVIRSSGIVRIHRREREEVPRRSGRNDIGHITGGQRHRTAGADEVVELLVVEQARRGGQWALEARPLGSAAHPLPPQCPQPLPPWPCLNRPHPPQAPQPRPIRRSPSRDRPCPAPPQPPQPAAAAERQRSLFARLPKCECRPLTPQPGSPQRPGPRARRRPARPAGPGRSPSRSRHGRERSSSCARGRGRRPDRRNSRPRPIRSAAGPRRHRGGRARGRRRSRSRCRRPHPPTSPGRSRDRAMAAATRRSRPQPLTVSATCRRGTGRSRTSLRAPCPRHRADVVFRVVSVRDGRGEVLAARS